MFRFKALELMNWDCYPHYRVPMDGEILLLVGPNGSGKTTFLDALRVLLNGSRLSKGRTLHHYIKKDVEIAMVKGLVSNELVGGRRPFAHLGFYGNGDVSLICLIRQKGPKKIEKEFFIHKGDVSLDDIKNLKGGLRSLQYSRQLEEAGVTRSTLKLIALEQGETDRIAQLPSEELLQLVMDITGNREIIKRYEEARRNYKRSFQQLIELKSEYNKLYQQMQALEHQAKQAQEFKVLLDEKKLIETKKLPLSRWYRILDKIRSVENDYNEMKEKKAGYAKSIRAICEEYEILKGKLSNVENLEIEVKQKQFKIERELNQMHQKIGKCNSDWQKIDNLRQDCESIPKDLDEEAVAKQKENVQEFFYKYKNDLMQSRNELTEIKKERNDLKNNKILNFPSEIMQFRKNLDKSGIENILFAECIEIINPKWQLAIEAFLGRERFSIFVDQKDFLKAKKLGEKHQYSNYISRFDLQELPRSINKTSVLANLKIIDNRINGRLKMLNNIILVETVEDGHKYSNKITITASGYRQDNRGGIFIGRNVKFFCGGLAKEHELKEKEKQINIKENEIEDLQFNLQNARQEIAKIDDKLNLVKKRQEWLNSIDLYEELRQEGEKLVVQSQDLEEKRNSNIVEFENLNEDRNLISSKMRELQRDKSKTEREQQQSEGFFREKESILFQLREEQEKLEIHLPIDSKAEYASDEIERVDWLEHKLQELEHHIEQFVGCRELSAITLFKNEEKQLLSKKRQLQRQEEDQTQRSQELENCRDDYKNMIVHTISFYNKSIKALAKLAGCKMKVFLELGRGDALIEDSKLYAKVSFDQKKEVDIRDKSLSGGQDVLTSLILLVGLSQIEQERGSGFFIMDEHNAHLDMLRIMEVGHFLRATQAQFVLTTPTTENIAALAVADLIITFSKHDFKKQYAAKPRYIRRM